MWRLLEDWTARAREAVARLHERGSVPQDWSAHALVEEIAREQRTLRAAVEALPTPLPVVFCHNDVRDAAAEGAGPLCSPTPRAGGSCASCNTGTCSGAKTAGS